MLSLIGFLARFDIYIIISRMQVKSDAFVEMCDEADFRVAILFSFDATFISHYARRENRMRQNDDEPVFFSL
jgi:hypothetical protein